MRENNLILDFNSSKLKFSINKISEYNFDTIYKNIYNFKLFINDTVKDQAFEKIYKTKLFQASLSNNETNDIDNLVQVYNTVVDFNLLEQQLPRINKSEMIRQLKMRDFTFKKKTVKDFNGNKIVILQAVSEKRLIFNE